MKKLNVVAAVIFDEDKILCVQRGEGGEAAFKWEFPGGKVENDEKPEQALIREIKEELDCRITVDDFIMTVRHQYESFHLTMNCYKCTIFSGELHLHEHIDSIWLSVSDLQDLDWAPADIPIMEMLMGDYKGMNESEEVGWGKKRGKEAW